MFPFTLCMSRIRRGQGAETHSQFSSIWFESLARQGIDPSGQETSGHKEQHKFIVINDMKCSKRCFF